MGNTTSATASATATTLVPVVMAPPITVIVDVVPIPDHIGSKKWILVIIAINTQTNKSCTNYIIRPYHTRLSDWRALAYGNKIDMLGPSMYCDEVSLVIQSNGIKKYEIPRKYLTAPLTAALDKAVAAGYDFAAEPPE